MIKTLIRSIRHCINTPHLCALKQEEILHLLSNIFVVKEAAWLSAKKISQSIQFCQLPDCISEPNPVSKRIFVHVIIRISYHDCYIKKIYNNLIWSCHKLVSWKRFGYMISKHSAYFPNFFANVVSLFRWESMAYS